MTEQVYRDLTGDIADIPDSTWEGIGAHEVYDFMVSHVPQNVEPNTSSLRGLAAQVRSVRPSQATRELAWVSPRLIELIDRQCDLEELG